MHGAVDIRYSPFVGVTRSIRRRFFHGVEFHGVEAVHTPGADEAPNIHRKCDPENSVDLFELSSMPKESDDNYDESENQSLTMSLQSRLLNDTGGLEPCIRNTNGWRRMKDEGRRWSAKSILAETESVAQRRRIFFFVLQCFEQKSAYPQSGRRRRTNKGATLNMTKQKPYMTTPTTPSRRMPSDYLITLLS